MCNFSENNRLIAEFMGGQRVLLDKDVYNMPTHNSLCYGVNELKYHTSWDWLMPVVERIRSVTSYDRDRFGTEVVIYGNKTSIKSGGYGEKEHGKLFFNRTIRGKYNSKEHTYEAVVEYIKWYNKNKK